MIMQLLSLGLSQIEIVSLLGCGAGRVDALRARIRLDFIISNPESTEEEKQNLCLSFRRVGFLYSTS